MSESAPRRHPLTGFLERHGAASAAHPGVSVTVRTAASYTNLRLDPRDASARTAAEEALGQPLPVRANTASRGTRIVYWLGPDEWLIVGTESDDVAARLEARLGGAHAAVNVQDGGYARLEIEGPDVRRALAKGCTLNLAAESLPRDACAQTGLAKAAVLLANHGKGLTLIVRRSFADYTARWLARAGAEYGVRFTEG